jgi:hypothetical protein
VLGATNRHIISKSAFNDFSNKPHLTDKLNEKKMSHISMAHWTDPGNRTPPLLKLEKLWVAFIINFKPNQVCREEWSARQQETPGILKFLNTMI